MVVVGGRTPRSGWCAVVLLALLLAAMSASVPSRVRADDSRTDAPRDPRNPVAPVAAESASFDALIESSDTALKRFDLATASAIYDELLRRFPAHADGATGHATVSVLRHAWPTAARWLAIATQIDPYHPRTMYLQGRMFERDGRYGDAVVLFDLAIEREPDPYIMLVRRAHVSFKNGDMGAAVEFAERAVELDPDRPNAHGLLGRGFVAPRAERSRQFRSESDREALARVAFETARADHLEGRHADAAAMAQLCIDVDPKHFGGPLILGVLALHAGQRERSIARLREAVRLAPDQPTARNALSVALEERQRANYADNEWPELSTFLAARPVPAIEDVPQLVEFVPEYIGLPPALQAECRRAAAPFRKWLEVLAKVPVPYPGRGRVYVKHHILPLTHSIVEMPYLGGLHRRRTFDGRLYDDVRGVGGVHACTGVEDIGQSADGLFNTFAHEVAHQLHHYAFGDELQARIEALYAAARERNAATRHGFLDYYAAHNSAEYFAQGIEAYVSLYKRVAAGDTGRHTRFELARVDPDLYEFIDGLVDHAMLDGLPGWADALYAAAMCHRRAENTVDRWAATKAYLEAWATNQPSSRPR